MTLLARLLANGGTGVQPTSQRASCGSGQSLSYVDPEKRKQKLIIAHLLNPTPKQQLKTVVQS